MSQNDLRTYQRRNVTRESGYHTCEETTGGECVVLKSDRHLLISKKTSLVFYRKHISLVSLFGKNIGILSFGGYIFNSKPITIEYRLSYTFNGSKIEETFEQQSPINENDWNNIGFHREIDVSNGNDLYDVMLEMTIFSEDDEGYVDFISFDFDGITKSEFLDKTFDASFHQKTSMHIPFLYYLKSDLKIDKYLINDVSFVEGQLVVLKSCNRCGRFLPINIKNELNTLSFSLHCKKKAPCTHSLFRSYTILNEYNKQELSDFGIVVDEDRVVTYYGHQLECKACKKFFVNMPLNPQRNSQQFKEDGLRRRAIEVLVNHLLQTNLIHFEFENKTKKEFTEYIWKKFECKCFKCKKKIQMSEMHLDHTMPLAYLYRLDETATCLCAEHNSKKSDHFPCDFYTEDELKELSRITGLSIETLKSRNVNQKVLDLLIENVVWFYDEFLMDKDYQKVRDGILTADKINDSLKRVIAGKVDLAEEYKKRTGKYPTSVTII